MRLYNKPVKQTLVDLINDSNPTLPFPINTVDYEFMPPEAITELPNGHNTKIRLFCRLNAPYIGNITLTYRRLDLAKLFANHTPIVQKWVESNGSTTATNHLLNLHDLLDDYSNKYGINLDKNEIQDYGLDQRYGFQPQRYSFPIRAESTSLIYIGSVNAKWDIGERTLESLFGDYEVNGRVYPGGNSFDVPEARKHYLTPTTFNVDFTEDYLSDTTYWEYSNNRQLGYTTSSTYIRMFDLIFNAFKREYDRVNPDGPTIQYTIGSNGYKNTPYDFNDFIIRRRTLPDVDYPEANSEFYNTVVVIETPADCTWAVGNIYLHYNRI